MCGIVALFFLQQNQYVMSFSIAIIRVLGWALIVSPALVCSGDGACCFVDQNDEAYGCGINQRR